MEIAALVTWIAAALGGFWLLGIWLVHRARPDTQRSRIGPGLVFGHFLLAAAGLVVWIVVVAATVDAALVWISVAVLVVVALLGVTMSARWYADRRGQPPPPTPEQRFPVGVVALHGLLGAATLVLVLLVAIGLD